MSVWDGQQPGSAEWVAHARESYDRVAKPYADLTRSSATDQPEMAHAYDRLAEQANPGLVVDVGCGPGWWFAHLASHGIEAVGVDLSPRMVELARLNAPGCRVEVGDVTPCTWPTRRWAEWHVGSCCTTCPTRTWAQRWPSWSACRVPEV